VTDFRLHQPLTDEEVEALRQEPEPALMAVRADALLATLDHRQAQCQARLDALQAEIDVLRGEGCEETKEGEPQSGPCGVCLKCAKRPNMVLLRASKAMLELLTAHQAKDGACTCSTVVGWCPVCGPHDVQDRLRIAIQDPEYARYLEEKGQVCPNDTDGDGNCGRPACPNPKCRSALA
jgi:hypothetical protein